MIPVELLFFGHPHMSYVRIILTKPLKTIVLHGFQDISDVQDTMNRLGFDRKKKFKRLMIVIFPKGSAGIRQLFIQIIITINKTFFMCTSNIKYLL